MIRLTPLLAERFAAIALGHVSREYPNKLDHVLDGEADAQGPRALHPIFYGSFDWHSCVHGYWMLATLLRLHPEGATAARIAARFDEVFTQEAVAGELAYLRRPSSRGFERPYGWAWLLQLAVALRSGGQGFARWSQAIDPLAKAFSERFKAFLPKADYPIRSGAHANTAFALRLAFDYAQAVEDDDLLALIRGRARLWYGGDRAASPWEPSGDDFLSPTLCEAVLMGDPHVNGEARGWLSAFLPDLEAGRPEVLFTPVQVSDRSDGKIAHLDGLNLSRAWGWRALAPRLAPHARILALQSAERHVEASLPSVEGHYMGEHWLASFAVLALTEP